MQLLREKEVPIVPTGVVFAWSRKREWVRFLICLGVGGIGLLAWLRPFDLPFADPVTSLAILFLPLGAMYAWFTGTALVQSYRPSNWLVRQQIGGLFVKFRNHLNSHFDPEDRVVIDLPREKVLWIRKRLEKRCIEQTRSADDNVRVESLTYLDIGLDLPNHELEQLQEALQDEVFREGPLRFQSHRGARRNPVRLMSDGLLRIEWKTESSSITPGIDEAVAVLGRDFVRDLISAGNADHAARLAQTIYGIDTTEAEELVRELQEQR